MNDLRAIEYLVEYPLSLEDIKGMLPEHAAALGLVSFAVTEINVLVKLFLSARHEPCKDDAVDWLVSTSQLVILRTWTAKLFEFSQFLSPGPKNAFSEEALRSLAKSALVELEVVNTRCGEGYKLACAVRHEAANHYSFDVAKKNLKHLLEGGDYTFYLHEEGGNSFFPLGEALMFAARLGKSIGTDQVETNIKTRIENWLDWCLEASKWVDRVNAAFVQKLVFERFPDRKANKRVHWISPALVGDTSRATVPVFLRKPRS